MTAGTAGPPGGIARPWNHNLHYHRVIVGAVPPGCGRALDVGCGQGALIRRLRPLIPEVLGVDRDERSVELARAHPGAGGVSYLVADFLSAPFEAGSFDFVTSVASLHHMDPTAALRRMAGLLRPGGVLAVVGLARTGLPRDLPLTIALIAPAVIGDRAHRLSRHAEPGAYQSPIVWQPALTYTQTRRLAGQILPGARYRRHLYWRYSLIWRKPR